MKKGKKEKEREQMKVGKFKIGKRKKKVDVVSCSAHTQRHTFVRAWRLTTKKPITIARAN